MRATRLRGALVGVFAFVLLPGAAVAAPIISDPGNGDVWNAATAPPSYLITGEPDGGDITWQLLRDGEATPLLSDTGPSPLTVTVPLRALPARPLRLLATPPGPACRAR